MCAQLAQDYDKAMTAARMCKAKADSCKSLAPQHLSGCGASCLTYVDKAMDLDMIQMKWTNAGCVDSGCPQPIACIPPISGSCDSTTGTCADLLSSVGL